MTTITTNKNMVTLINVFTVQPENQQRLVDLLTEATKLAMKKQPGYISAKWMRGISLGPLSALISSPAYNAPTLSSGTLLPPRYSYTLVTVSLPRIARRSSSTIASDLPLHPRRPG